MTGKNKTFSGISGIVSKYKSLKQNHYIIWANDIIEEVIKAFQAI